MKAVNKRKKFIAPLCQFVGEFSRLGGGRGRFPGSVIAGNKSPMKGEKKFFFRENRFQVADSRSRKRLLFQRNFYIYPSVKRKPRILFLFPYSPPSRLIPFLSLFSFLPSFLPPLFFFSPHVLLPSRAAFARNTKPDTRDFRRASR